jgi:hypothetical protein
VGTTQKIDPGSEKGYFIRDTFEQYDWVQTFDDAKHWHAALTAAGIPPNIPLTDPATLTFQNHRFFHYGVMGKLFGLTDDAWFGVVMLTTLAAMFVGGLLVRTRWGLFGLAIPLGWVLTIALTDSSGGFIGFVAYPLFYWLVGQVGRVLRRFCWDRWKR